MHNSFYKPLYLLFALLLPVAIPVWLWNENYWHSLLVCYFARYVILLHITWSVNSVAHFFGTKPFDKSMLAVESFFVSFVSVGEGWHNYHHAFPWDYRAAEYGTSFSITTFVIDVLAYFGLAYDLKTTPANMVQRRALRTGDGSYEICADDGQANIITEADVVTEENNNYIPNGDLKHEQFMKNSMDANGNCILDKALSNGKVSNGNFLNGKVMGDIDKNK